MTPAERANLEYTYDQLYKLYEGGNIRPGEMQELQRLDDMLRPTWTSEEAQAVAQEQPMLMSREPTVSESVEDWWADKIRRVSGDTPFPLDARDSQRLGKRIAGLLEFVPGPSTMMSGAQARRDIASGDYGSAAMNTGFGLLDAIPAFAATRGPVLNMLKRGR